MGEKYTIVPHEQKPLNSFFCMCRHIARKCRFIPVVRTIFKALSYGKISQQASDHSLKNFAEVFANGNGYVKSSGSERLMSIEEATTGKEPLKYDEELFKFLKDPSIEEFRSHKKPLSFSMTDPATYERIEFSYEQLHKALLEKNPQKLRSSESLPQQTSVNKSFVDQFALKKGLKNPSLKKEYVPRSGEDVIQKEQSLVSSYLR